MPGKILATGFDRFGVIKRSNPSSEIILPALAAERSVIAETLVLPTTFDTAANELQDAIKEISPIAVVMFGVASSIDPIRLERQAKNLRFSPVPDNDGQFRFGRISKSGPKALGSTLPLMDIFDDLRAADIPVKVSRSAGHFVCNDVFYQTLSAQQEGSELAPVPTGFIHVGSRLSDDMLRDSAVRIIDKVHSYATDPSS